VCFASFLAYLLVAKGSFAEATWDTVFIICHLLEKHLLKVAMNQYRCF
jgi:hypothetical protein